MSEKLEFTSADMRRFKKFTKDKSPWEVNFAIGKQTNLREFKEKFRVDKSSNLHCPWCWNGTLYELEELGKYICRQCELKWEIHSITPEELTLALEAKKEERRQRREDRKAEGSKSQIVGLSPDISLETELLAEQAEKEGYIECPGCKNHLEPDTESCTCGWKNPLVGLGLI